MSTRSTKAYAVIHKSFPIIDANEIYSNKDMVLDDDERLIEVLITEIEKDGTQK